MRLRRGVAGVGLLALLALAVCASPAAAQLDESDSSDLDGLELSMPSPPDFDFPSPPPALDLDDAADGGDTFSVMTAQHGYPPAISVGVPRQIPVAAQPQPILRPVLQQRPILMPQPIVAPRPVIQLQQPIVRPVMTQPILRPVVQQPILRPVVQQPIVRSVIQQPILRPVVQQPIVRPVVQPVIQREVVQPIIKREVVQPVVKPIIKPVIKPIVKPVVKPIVMPVIQPVVKPVVVQPVVKQPVVQLLPEQPKAQLIQPQPHPQPEVKEVELPLPKPKLELPELPVLEAAPAKPEAVAQPACPAISFTHKMTCSSSGCALNFVNLSPSPLLDWVDVHLKSSSGALSFATGVASPSDAQLNLRMGLAAGPQGTMHMEMDMGAEHGGATAEHGAMPMAMPMGEREAAPLGMGPELSQSVLQETGGSQVFSLALPQLGGLSGAEADHAQLQSGGKLQVKFTYCANGVDCDTEEFTYDLAQLEQIKTQLGQGGQLQEAEGGEQPHHEQIQQPLAQFQQRSEGEHFPQPRAQLKLRGQRCQTICEDIDEAEPAEQPPQQAQLGLGVGQTRLTHIEPRPQQSWPVQHPTARASRLALGGESQPPSDADSDSESISNSDIERVLNFIHPRQQQPQSLSAIGEGAQQAQFPLSVSPAQQLEQNVDLARIQLSHTQPQWQSQQQQQPHGIAPRIALGSSAAQPQLQHQSQRDADVESVLRALHPARPLQSLQSQGLARPVLGAGPVQFQTQPQAQRLQLSSLQQRPGAPLRFDQSDDLFDHDIDDAVDD